MARIFISYRRDDSGGWAGRLYDRLSQHFGRDNVFMDIDTIEPGLDFVEVIEQAVSSCDVLVALIGRQWLTITDNSGRRRLYNPEDFVRLEIAAALARNIRVIPALVQGARMPHSTDLPDVLTMLGRRNAIDISETRFHYDVDRLIAVLDNVLKGAEPTVAKNDAAIAHTVPPSNVDIMGRPEPAPKIVPRAQQRSEESGTARQPFEPEMILIPAGEFLMGSDPQQDKNAFNDEQPQHRLSLPDYFLAKTPVTQAQFREFVRATGHETPQGWTNGTPPHGKDDHPVVHVSWHDGMAYCRWLSEVTGRGYRLPSEAEWEKGARGADGRIYPWGNQWDAARCNADKADQGDTTPVDAYLQGASPYGVLDMAGNVWEWTRSMWGKSGKRPDYRYPYRSTDGRENLATGQEVLCVRRGGAFDCDHWHVRCACRGGGYPNSRRGVIGFRVVVRQTS